MFGSWISPQAEPGVKLYKYVRAGAVGDWRLLSSFARPRLYDSREDGGGSKQEWFLEVEGGGVDAKADNTLNYMLDLKAKRITFTVRHASRGRARGAATLGVWGLGINRLPTAGADCGWL